MTKEGIKKLARLDKKAEGFWQTLGDAGKILLGALVVLTAGGGFAAGTLYSRATAPRQTDSDNVTKQYQIQRLKNDITKQKALLNRQSVIYDDLQKPKKSVYGIV